MAEGTKTCPSCGNQTRASATFCTQCGAAFDMPPPSGTAAETPGAQPGPPPTAASSPPPAQSSGPASPPGGGAAPSAPYGASSAGTPPSTPRTSAGDVPGAPPGGTEQRAQQPMRIILLAGVTAVVVGLVVFALTRGGGDGTPAAATSPDPTAATQTQPTAPPEEDQLPTPPAGAEFFVRITDITVEGDDYVVAFETFGYEPRLGGSEHHIHFFFDTVRPSQAGVPGSGPWKIWPDRLGEVGQSPFRGYGVAEAPQGATQMCTLVANADHSVILESGTCMPLP